MSVRIGPFEVGELLGSGGYGRVYDGRHAQLGQPVAVKVIGLEAGEASLEHEIAVVARLNHPHIVRIYDFGRLEHDAIGPVGSPYFVMERCSGGSLGQARNLPQSFAALKSTLLKLLDAVAHAHAAGIVHRDLKLANVLFADASDGRPGMRLVDFGLAGFGDEGTNAGTPRYMPPEQYQTDPAHLGPWTDLYALGVLGWRLACGGTVWGRVERNQLLTRKLAEQTEPFRPRFGVPDGFEDWLRTLLRARWDQRFLSVAAAAQALGALDARSQGNRAGPALEDALTRVAPASSSFVLLDVAPIHEPPPPATVPPRFTGHPDWLPSRAMLSTGAGLLALREPTLVGRAEEQRRLWTWARHALESGEHGSIAITGPGGVGRRRLASWLARQLHIDGGARFAVLEREAPLGLLLLARVLGLWRADPEAVRTRVQGMQLGTQPVLQMLAALEQVPDDHEKVGWALALNILGVLCERQPVVLVFVDVDRSVSLGHLYDLVGQLEPRILRVATARTLDADHRLTLEPLARTGLVRILESWAPLHWASVNQVLQASGGLPGRMVADVRTRPLVLEGDELVIAPTPDLGAQWVEALPPEDRPVAVVLGLLGPFVPDSALETVLEPRGLAAEPLLARLERRGHLRRLALGWAFTDPSLPQALAAAEGEPPRPLLHDAAVALAAEGHVDRAVQLALEARDDELAARVFFNSEMVRTRAEVERFLEAVEGMGLHEMVVGRALVALVRVALAERHEDAVELTERALAQLVRLRWFYMAGQVGRHLWTFLRRPLQDAIDLFEQAEPTPDRDWYLAQCYTHRAVETGEERDWEQALAYAATARGDFRLAATRSMHAVKFLQDPVPAVRWGREAVEAAPNLVQREVALIYLQHMLLQAHRFAEAVEVGYRGLELARWIGSRTPHTLLVNTAMAHARQGQWSQAADCANHVLALPDVPPWRSLARLISAVAAAREGNPDDAVLLVPQVRPLLGTLYDQADPDVLWLVEQLKHVLRTQPGAVRLLAQLGTE